MTDEEPPRTRAARTAAELALVRVAHHYGGRPEFVLLGGLVPHMLCAQAPFPHAGTTDVDVQVDLEIAGGAVNAARLEQALRNADFAPDDERTWRWNTELPGSRTVVKFELLADLDTEPAGATVVFDDCDDLGAANLRGIGFAARDIEVRTLSAKDAGVWRTAEINVTGLAGFLMAKVAAAYGRRKPKDWYDLAYVLLHNDAGGPQIAANTVLDRFGKVSSAAVALADLAANFADTNSQGSSAYAEQATLDDPTLAADVAATDAVLAVNTFTRALLD